MGRDRRSSNDSDELSFKVRDRVQVDWGSSTRAATVTVIVVKPNGAPRLFVAYAWRSTEREGTPFVLT